MRPDLKPLESSPSSAGKKTNGGTPRFPSVERLPLTEFKSLAIADVLLVLAALLVRGLNASSVSAFLYLCVLGYSLGKTIEKARFVAVHSYLPRKAHYIVVLVLVEVCIVAVTSGLLLLSRP